MVTRKIGQASHNEVTQLQQQHFDLDMRIREYLDMLSIEMKQKLVAKMPMIIDEINAELKSSENDI